MGKYKGDVEEEVIRLIFEESDLNFQQTETQLKQLVLESKKFKQQNSNQVEIRTEPNRANKECKNEQNLGVKQEVKQMRIERKKEEKEVEGEERGEEELVDSEESEEEGGEEGERGEEYFISFVQTLFPKYETTLLQELYKESGKEPQKLIQTLLSFDETEDLSSTIEPSTNTSNNKRKKKKKRTKNKDFVEGKGEEKKEAERKEEGEKERNDEEKKEGIEENGENILEKEMKENVEKLAELFPKIPRQLLPIILEENGGEMNQTVEYLFQHKVVYQNAKGNKEKRMGEWETFNKNNWAAFTEKKNKETQFAVDPLDVPTLHTPLSQTKREDPNSLCSRLKFKVLEEKFASYLPPDLLKSVFLECNTHLENTMECLKKMFPWLSRVGFVDHLPQQNQEKRVEKQEKEKKAPTHLPKKKKPQFVLVKSKPKKKVRKGRKKGGEEEAVGGEAEMDSEEERRMMREEEDSFLGEKDLNYFLQRAQFHSSQRRILFMKATNLFSLKKYSSARSCIRRGQIHDEIGRKANEQARLLISSDKTALQVFKKEHQNSEYTNKTVDLHGYRVVEALQVVEQVLQFQQSRKTLKTRNNKVTFITGKGQNSRQNIPKIKLALVQFCQDNKISFSEPHPGAIEVLI